MAKTKASWVAVASVKDCQLHVAIPLDVMAAACYVVQDAERKTSGHVRVTLELPSRPRTTGPQSQNHAINGYVQQIAVAIGMPFETIKLYCKDKAKDRGYPFDTMPDGSTYPISESLASVEDAAALIETIQHLAAEVFKVVLLD